MNRRSGGIFLLPLAGTALYAMLAFGAPWRGQWEGTIDAVTGTTVLTGPLTAAFAAHIALGQSRMGDLLASTPRGPLVPYRSALHAGLWSSLVFVLTAAGGFAVTAALPHGGAFSWWAVLIGSVVLGACALAGSLAIRIWPHRMSVILVAPLVFLLGGFGPAPYAALLRQGPSTGSLAGLEYVPRMWLLQVAGLLGLVGVVVVALLPWSRSSVRARTAFGVLMSIAVLLTSGALLNPYGEARFRASSEKPTACAGEAPEACLAPSDQRLLPSTALSLQRAARHLRRAGVVVPSRYEELLPGYQPSVDVGVIASPVEGGSTLRAGAAILVIPAGCPIWTDPDDPPPPAAFGGQELLVDWILAEAGELVTPSSPKTKAWLADANSSAAEQWVRVTFDHLRRCELDRVKLPWHSGGQ